MITDAHKATLKAALYADTDEAVVQALSVGDDAAIARLYNAEASPAFYVWRTSLSSEQARAAIVGSSDGLAQLDNLTVGKRDSLLWVFGGNTDPSNANQRAAIENLCGTQNLLKAAIAAGQKRTATKAEKVLATGTGSSASPASLGWEGSLSDSDVAKIKAA